MKEYQDEFKKRKIQDVMQQRTPVSFKVLEQLEADGMLEDYDLFRVLSEHFKDIFMFYMDKKFHLIMNNKEDFKEIDREFLHGRYFVLNRCITNSIQGFIQRKGIKAFNELSTKEFIQQMLMNSDSLLNYEEER